MTSPGLEFLEIHPMTTGVKIILVTGGAGYIGSHAVLALKQAGYQVVILDNLVYGHRDLVETVLKTDLVEGSTLDKHLLQDIFSRYDISAVMHFSAYAYVGESVTNPSKYYENNLVGTLSLLDAMVEADIKNFVFSSTCATYGVPQAMPITETHPQNPINPYGATKLMVERILADYDKAYDFRAVCFRYFNAAGAHPNGLLGEDHDPETHLIPLVLQTALGKRESINIFGTDYPTPDGTCIRDYIHVCDLADAHILGLEYLLQGGQSATFNLGNGSGFSVREVIDAAKRITQKTIPVVEVERRPGDPPALVGGSDRARSLLGWKPQYADIDSILTHAWAWHQARHC
ncbi:MAG: UDP-glucose 4-epimerase GalE [Cyanobacteria bacterium J06638_6]